MSSFQKLGWNWSPLSTHRARDCDIFKSLWFLVFLVHSGDKASWCLVHTWSATVWMLLVRFHGYMSPLHPNHADKPCIMTGRTFHSSVTTCFKATRVWVSELLQPCKDSSDCCLGFYRTAGAAGRDRLMQRCAVKSVIAGWLRHVSCTVTEVTYIIYTNRKKAQ